MTSRGAVGPHFECPVPGRSLAYDPVALDFRDERRPPDLVGAPAPSHERRSQDDPLLPGIPIERARIGSGLRHRFPPTQVDQAFAEGAHLLPGSGGGCLGLVPEPDLEFLALLASDGGMGDDFEPDRSGQIRAFGHLGEVFPREPELLPGSESAVSSELLHDRLVLVGANRDAVLRRSLGKARRGHLPLHFEGEPRVVLLPTQPQNELGRALRLRPGRQTRPLRQTAVLVPPRLELDPPDLRWRLDPQGADP